MKTKPIPIATLQKLPPPLVQKKVTQPTPALAVTATQVTKLQQKVTPPLNMFQSMQPTIKFFALFVM